jgi:hypothetical protein
MFCCHPLISQYFIKDQTIRFESYNGVLGSKVFEMILETHHFSCLLVQRLALNLEYVWLR